ncbi:MAG: ESX-1 secretion-associated protein [Mycobacteriaceae bacterium]|nr:ESX-1 secretion-associated protein [Mycobacteriaceae bacterium]
MDKLTVTPEYLEKLAQYQDRANAQATATSETTSGVSHEAAVSHGVISTPSNEELRDVEHHRRAAVHSVADAAARLAANLRALEETYLCVDTDAGRHIDRQMGGQ